MEVGIMDFGCRLVVRVVVVRLAASMRVLSVVKKQEALSGFYDTLFRQDPLFLENDFCVALVDVVGMMNDQKYLAEGNAGPL
mmetsp:Transcript_17536/g.36325  ORF Transcript_17536/g.36325 Transcript_17536/m.36325 type:complete len:82 (+) Transcript_17536:1880-2125(+)